VADLPMKPQNTVGGSKPTQCTFNFLDRYLSSSENMSRFNAKQRYLKRILKLFSVYGKNPWWKDGMTHFHFLDRFLSKALYRLWSV
jgi:hypothetical protein